MPSTILLTVKIYPVVSRTFFTKTVLIDSEYAVESGLNSAQKKSIVYLRADCHECDTTVVFRYTEVSFLWKGEDNTLWPFLISFPLYIALQKI